MGHLINPVAFRLGWFAGWCDSWYSDHLYYPEFLHDIFRVRLFLNYFFSLLFFEKAALSFSHFEFFHKYTFLTLRVFYYDGIIMEGLFAFQADLSNRYLRRKFKRNKRRHGTPWGSRYGRIFLAIFFNFFRFSTFFKSTYLTKSLPQKVSLQQRTFKVRSLADVLYAQSQKRFVLRLREHFRVMAKNRAQREGRPYVPRRILRQGGFMSYNKLFKPWWTPRRFFRGKGKPFFKFSSKTFKREYTVPQGSKVTPRWKSAATINSYKSDKSIKVKGKGQRSSFNKTKGKVSGVGIFNAMASSSKKRVETLKRRKYSTFRQVAYYSEFKVKDTQRRSWPKDGQKKMDRPVDEKVLLERRGQRPFLGSKDGQKKIDKPVEVYTSFQKSPHRHWAKAKEGVFFERSRSNFAKGTELSKSTSNFRPKAFDSRYSFSKAKGQAFNFKSFRPGSFTAPTRVDFTKILVRRRRRKIRKLFKFTLKHCRLGKFDSYLKGLRLYFTKGLPLVPEIKIFLIFIVLFRRIWFLFQGDQLKLSKFDFLKELFFTASFLLFFNGYSFKVFSSILVCLLKQAGLHYLSLRVGIFLISNETVTAVFLANFVGRKLVQGYRVRSVLSPVMKDLYKSSLSIEPPKVGEVSFLKQELFSKGYRSGVAKAFILKFFFIYKRLYGKVFWLSNSWLNFYFYKNLVRFLDKFSSSSRLLLGACKKFMLQKHGLLFFFNFDNAFITKNFSFVFNDLFFDFTNRSSLGHSIFFFFICDDLFSHSNVLFFGQSWKKLSMDHWYVATLVFFNRLVRYSFWSYSRSWLLEVNGINKLRMRAQKPFKKHGILGFKFHLRGRFTRKQKASSLWYVRGQLPLTLSSASIDYAFRAYPLKNSLVSIKVWLYKGVLTPQWFVRQF